jgi:site-specific DNA-methyltransferase (adenine-specific)/modification methylase
MLPKPYYDDGDGHVIYFNDNKDIIPFLPKIDLILSDPPYGINHPTNYASRGRGKLANCKDYPAVYGDGKPFDPAMLLKLDCPLILWGANHYASRLPDSGGWLVWDKQRPEKLDQSTCELAWTNCIHGVRIFHWLWNGMMRRGNERLVHPTQKPVALLKWCLSLVPEYKIIVDPYMGAGSTIRGAKEMGCKAVGIEIREEYCKEAVNNLSQMVLPFGEI